MSEEELERIYTINLGKVLLSQPQHRAVRALNMVREFARRHMKVEDVKIDEDLARQIWAKGARSPPRKLRVKMQKIEYATVLVGRYDGPVDAAADAPKVGGPAASGIGAAASTVALPESSPDSTLGEVNLETPAGEPTVKEEEGQEEYAPEDKLLQQDVPVQPESSLDADDGVHVAAKEDDEPPAGDIQRGPEESVVGATVAEETISEEAGPPAGTDADATGTAAAEETADAKAADADDGSTGGTEAVTSAEDRTSEAGSTTSTS